MFTILVMGLPESGKSTFSASLVKKLEVFCTVKWINADAVRAEYNDWDFTEEGRKRQAFRMKGLAHKAATDGIEVAILDFVCPTAEFRKIVDPNIIVFMNTRDHSQFADTNKMFCPVTDDELIDSIYTVATFSEVKYRIDKISLQIATALNKNKGNFTLHQNSHLRSIVKGATYRMFGSSTTFFISWVVTGSLPVAGTIIGFEIICKIFVYYLHERIWAKI